MKVYRIYSLADLVTDQMDAVPIWSEEADTARQALKKFLAGTGVEKSYKLQPKRSNLYEVAKSDKYYALAAIEIGYTGTFVCDYIYSTERNL